MATNKTLKENYAEGRHFVSNAASAFELHSQGLFLALQHLLYSYAKGGEALY
jgi:hypothetical protein